MTNFNSIVSFYDTLARLVFADRINYAKRSFIGEILPWSRVLILGGGTGRILEYLAETDSELEITYVELSDQMMRSARQRKLGNHRVDFVLEDYFKFQTEELYDVVICDFFLDLFEDEMLNNVIQRIRQHLTPQGKLVVSDFQIVDESIWQRMLSALMHWYFRFLAQLDSRRLLDIDLKLTLSGFVREQKMTFYRGFIFSALYRVGKE
ncbi:class I SAM-dependent methyltransferase [Reichenbachiella agarivorans]|uniref:Class I SAM-dependent methyltransferase n=1 Tax=Reichenbachiella agarivorans TaxID=2979464 RepID=A0ABY6CTC1_9BACT|nr:class I SAM-dependent methyltransferase [Reichenbachiella agarivorans]UXP33774.1 class I SAM-dependent methyltransferase [Reichenbachiella agarivorans]